MFQLLTSPEALAQPTQSKRFMVQLESKELDFEGVPEDWKILDVCVTDAATIKTLLDAAGYLTDWRIVRHWIPEDCDCF